MGRAGQRRPSDAIAVGMAIGLFIAGGAAVLGTGRSGDESPIYPAGQAALVVLPGASPYDAWLAPAGSPTDHLALHAVAGSGTADGAVPADRDPFWALTSRTDAPAPLRPCRCRARSVIMHRQS